jgi:beta-mannosidase
VQRSIHTQADGAFEIEFSSPVFQHSVEFDLAGINYRASDNFFDLYPNVPHHVLVRAANLDETELAERLTTRSLVDSY